jgi:tRNA dimethylallyltransferase
MSKNLIIVTGPTAAGKTRAGIEIARRLGTEIVSADSRQIYRELNIGTAVPSKEKLNSVKHHFIHSHSVFENYNASIYEKEALELLDKLFVKFPAVLMVGGSMLYINAICCGIDYMPDVDTELRNNLKIRMETEGIESLRMMLKQTDPAYYREADLKNPARIIRALEISLMTGKPYSSFRLKEQKKRPFKIIKIGLNLERDELYGRINRRVDKMVIAGLEEEAKKFYGQRGLNALNTPGYREFFSCFDGEISRDKAIELIKRNTRRYARKQLTWFRKDKSMKWFHPDEIPEIISYIETVTEK